MKVLVSAYACEPGEGSEPGAGWTWVRAAALEHDVWVMTRENNRPAIESAMHTEPSLRLNPVYLDLPSWARRWKRGQRGVHAYYILWQWKCRRVAKDLHRAHHFDVAHHITFAVDWMPAGVVGIAGLPAVWGPVGGASRFPWALRRYFGAQPFMKEVVRTACTAPMRFFFGRWAARKANLVVAQNREVARYFRRNDPIIEPNVALPSHGAVVGHRTSLEGEERTALFVGRVVAWKGVLLAIATIAEPAALGWRLRVVGTGADLERAKQLAADLGVADRIDFVGKVSRTEVPAELDSADVFLFPSMHDSAPWAVGEAILAHLPVVCLDECGPSVLLERTEGGIAVAPSSRAAVDLANALTNARPSRSPDRLLAERLLPLVTDWYRSAARSPEGASRPQAHS